MSGVLRRWLAPRVVGRLKSALHIGNCYSGKYPDWASAAAASTGYDATIILQKVRDSMRKVRNGEAACERDSVVFDELQLSFPVLAGLLRAATAAAGGHLSVIDFGGALGSSYFQCRDFLSPLGRLSWSVVEQDMFVRAGREEFQDDALRFDYTLAEACAAIRPNVALLSGVLQYLPDPYSLLDDIAKQSIPHIVIDRLVVSSGDRDRIAVQHVPASIYKASYPIRIFADGAIERALVGRYRVVARFDCVWDGSHTEYCGALAFDSRGMILQAVEPR